MKFGLIAAAGIVTQTHASVLIDTKNRVFRDEEGRQLLFHGVNVIYKVAPYIPPFENDSQFDPQESLVPVDIENLKKWGINFVRLGVMWEAVEIAPGKYDEAYLDHVEQLINKLGEQGILTMVDMHQDVLARINCGEGIPDFYAREVSKNATCHGNWSDPKYDFVKTVNGECRSILSYNYARDENDWPQISECNKTPFFKYYTTAESLEIWDALYTNKEPHNLTDKFVAYWDRLARKFANNQYVMGFDPINEPYPSDFMADPSILEPGMYDKKKLAPLYERVFEAWYSHNPNSIMYFETGQIPDSYLGVVNQAGFEQAPGGKVANNALNDHSYCCQLSPEMCLSGEPDLTKGEECRKWHHDRINTRAEDAKKLGVPLIVSEFGACFDSEACEREINQVLDECDLAISGWAYWQFKIYKDLTTTAGTGSEGFYNEDGSLQVRKVKALARTYLVKTPGTLKQQQFNSTTGNFIARFEVGDKTTEVKALLYANTEFWYPNGYHLRLSKIRANKVLAETIDKKDVIVKKLDPNYVELSLSAEERAKLAPGDSIQIELVSKKQSMLEKFLLY